MPLCGKNFNSTRLKTSESVSPQILNKLPVASQEKFVKNFTYSAALMMEISLRAAKTPVFAL
jgi:hypothetical protein